MSEFKNAHAVDGASPQIADMPAELAEDIIAAVRSAGIATTCDWLVDQGHANSLEEAQQIVDAAYKPFCPTFQAERRAAISHLVKQARSANLFVLRALREGLPRVAEQYRADIGSLMEKARSS